MYAAPVKKEDAFHYPTVDACKTICIQPYISAWTRWFIMRRVEVGTKFHGGYFENLF
jgi:hypothetical protein